jgi:serine/threonine protein kinase
MEFAELGNLENFIVKTPLVKVEWKWQVFLNIAVGLQYLHNQKIIHRDLKLSNILVFEESKNRPLPYRFVLSDFGTALDIEIHGRIASERTGGTGTVETMAPELLEQIESGEYTQVHSYSSDVWSLGVILFSLFFGNSPFGGNDGESLLRNFTDFDSLFMERSSHMENVPGMVIILLKRMLTRDPGRRIVLNEILQNKEIIAMMEEFGLSHLEEVQQRPPRRPPTRDQCEHGTQLAIGYEVTEGSNRMPSVGFFARYQFLFALLLALFAMGGGRWVIFAGLVIIVMKLFANGFLYLIPLGLAIEGFPLSVVLLTVLLTNWAINHERDQRLI